MRILLLAACLLPAPATLAQDAAPAPPAPPASAADATDLEPVRVIGRRPDPFGFRNPVEAEGTVFSRDWDEPPSIEEIGLRGGILQIGINKGLELAAKGIRSLPYWQDQVIGAQARPPPLDEAQLARAARLRGADARPGGEGANPREIAPPH